jgi:hypothetical protein
MSTDGILYNETKKEYVDFCIMNMEHNWEANVDLLYALTKLIDNESGKWRGDIIKYAYDDGSPDSQYALVCFGDPYDNYKTDYKEISLND